MKNGFELKISENRMDGWKEHIPFTEDRIEFMKRLDNIIDIYGAESRSSYMASYKVNGGYKENQKKGSTVVIKWKGKLCLVYALFNFPDPNDYNPVNAIQFKNEEWQDPNTGTFKRITHNNGKSLGSARRS